MQQLSKTILLQVKFEMMYEMFDDIDTLEFDSLFKCDLYVPVYKMTKFSIFI